MAYAAIALEDSLGLTASAFGFASGIFFIGYFMFEIPSNAGTIKFGPRIWFARILITWGIFAVLMGFVRTPMELYICRFMLGVCEAGFSLGCLLLHGVFPGEVPHQNPRHVYHRTAVVERYRFTDFWADP